jgi:hypothetical protein
MIEITNKLPQRWWQTRRPWSAVLWIVYPLIVVWAYQHQVLGLTADGRPRLWPTYGILGLGPFFAFGACFLWFLSSRAQDKQHKLVQGRAALDIETLHTQFGGDLTLPDFEHAWKVAVGELAGGWDVFRPSDTLTSVGFGIRDFDTGMPSRDHYIALHRHEVGTLSDVARLVHKWRTGVAAGVSRWQINARLLMLVGLTTGVVALAIGANPAKALVESTWSTAHGVVEVVQFDTLLSLPGRGFHKDPVRFVPRWTYRFTADGQEWWGSSLLQDSNLGVGSYTRNQMIASKAVGSLTVHVAYDEKRPWLNAATPVAYSRRFLSVLSLPLLLLCGSAICGIVGMIKGPRVSI